MAVLHRALFTWFVVLVFLIVLVLRLDGRTQWNWFVVLAPVWVYDSMLAFYVLFNAISHCKNGHDRAAISLHRKVWYAVAIALKMAAQILLCLKLEYNDVLNVSVYHVMAPLWVLLPALFTDMFVLMVDHNRRF